MNARTGGGKSSALTRPGPVTQNKNKQVEFGLGWILPPLNNSWIGEL